MKSLETWSCENWAAVEKETMGERKADFSLGSLAAEACMGWQAARKAINSIHIVKPFFMVAKIVKIREG